jgi:uncharacterized protein (DUF1697 family)
MTRYIAFLRAINVGGRVVTMSRLRDVFAGLGFRSVETFIASGNVVFESRVADTVALERKIERALGAALGYEVATFVRTPAQVAAIARYEPFPADVLSGAVSLNVGFMAAAPAEAAHQALESLPTTGDRFHINGAELYWMLEKKQSESKISNGVLERAVKARATFRGINTIRRLDAKLMAAADAATARVAGNVPSAPKARGRTRPVGGPGTRTAPGARTLPVSSARTAKPRIRKKLS